MCYLNFIDIWDGRVGFFIQVVNFFLFFVLFLKVFLRLFKLLLAFLALARIFCVRIVRSHRGARIVII